MNAHAANPTVDTTNSRAMQVSYLDSIPLLPPEIAQVQPTSRWRSLKSNRKLYHSNVHKYVCAVLQNNICAGMLLMSVYACTAIQKKMFFISQTSPGKRDVFIFSSSIFMSLLALSLQFVVDRKFFLSISHSSMTIWWSLVKMDAALAPSGRFRLKR